MNPEIKSKWVAALRSGEYKQGRKVLHSEAENTFCCLGVLCDLAVKEGIVHGETTFNPLLGTITTYVGSDNSSTYQLPSDVRDWADLESPQESQSFLSELNDVHGADFETIADYIEQSL
jgi:hypothetical protein